MFYKDPQQRYRVRELDGFAWLDYGFGTRDSRDWPPRPYAWVKQIHSNIAVVVDGRAGCLGEADALISNRVGTYLTIRSADCIPILLIDERLKAVAAVHAGWRGTVAGVAPKAIEAMRDSFGTRPEDLLAAIGPGICGRCYTVGPEVAAQFVPWFPERSDLDRQTVIDLPEANRRQLAAAGVPEARIFRGAPCTLCGPEEFFSYRRTRDRTGRMVTAIAVQNRGPQA